MLVVVVVMVFWALPSHFSLVVSIHPIVLHLQDVVEVDNDRSMPSMPFHLLPMASEETLPLLA